MHYRVIDDEGYNATPAKFETFEAAKQHADRFHKLHCSHHGVVRVEQVYTTSTIEDALKEPREPGVKRSG